MAPRRFARWPNSEGFEKARKIRRNNAFAGGANLSEGRTIVWSVAFPH
jgi:hypothetical protein